MENKLKNALAYVKARAEKESNGKIDNIRNDAANIFADSYEEYLTIWDFLEGKEQGK